MLTQNSKHILVGDRVFFFEQQKGLQEPATSGFGLVLEIVSTLDSKKYSHIPFHDGEEYFKVAVILCDATGDLEEQLVKDCIKQESW